MTPYIAEKRTTIAPSPPRLLALPEAPIGWRYAITPAGCILSVNTGGETPAPRQYHESFLQLFGLDLTDPGDITRFLNNNGPLGFAEGDDLGFDWHAGYGRLIRPVLEEAGREIAMEIADWDRQAGRTKHYGLIQSLAQFWWQATCLRDLIRAWRWYREDIVVEPQEWESPVWAEEDERFARPTSPEDAAELVRQGIRSGLRPFHPELRIKAYEGDTRWTADYGGGLGFYYICCLELFNLIVRDSALAQCANERCQRMFGLQEGRSQKGRHRSVGVKYCSLSCARAQAQRDYRRRQARAAGA